MPGKRILLVDYDPKSLNHTREILEGAGFTVSTCGDGISAIDHYTSTSPDLVLLSAMLPKMHGFEVCSSIRKLPGGNTIPVVIITDVYKGKRYRTDAINKYGATEYIEKPIEDANLISILNGLVDNGQKKLLTDVMDDRTVAVSRDLLDRMVKEETTGATKPVSEKKAVSDKPKPSDDIAKKLEQSLAGLDLDVTRRSKPKPKPESPKASPSATAGQPQTSAAQTGSGDVFTSEDLFTDIIASVERELLSEKIISAPESEGTTSGDDVASPPTVAMSSPTISQPVSPASKPAAPPKASEAAKKSTGFDSALEKKLSSTLSGLVKEKKAEPAKAAPAAPKTPEKTADAAPAPAAEPEPAIKIESKPGVVAKEGTAVAAEREIAQEGINFGQYLLLGKIATGGMAELFKAKRKGVEGFEKILAIKRILPHMSDNEEFVTMFIDEAKLAAQLTHHNICQIFDLGKIENSYYIAMEYVHGKELRAILKTSRQQGKSISVNLAILIASKIASALDYAHRKRGSNGQPLNLVHRDVSPQNILISYEGEVKLVDFGIAKAATKAHVTQHGALKGKLLYMSPEQAWGKSVDKRSDLFSLGVVLYEMLASRPLFLEDQDTEVSILEKVREAKIMPIREVNPNVPAELERILDKVLHKNPDERYQLAFDFQKDLDNLFYSEGFNATSAALANLVRELFPEEWSQEAGGKEASAAPAALPATAAPAKKEKEKPKQKAKDRVAEEAKPQPLESKPEKEPGTPKEAPLGASVDLTAPPQVETRGFRDISAPDFAAPTAKKFPVMPAAIIGLAIAVGLVAFFLFRSDTSNQQVSTTPAVTSVPAPTPAPSQDQPQPADPEPSDPATAAPVPAPGTEDAKSKEDAKTKEAENKLIEQQKAEEAKRKQEEERKKAEDQKKEEARKKEEQARLEEEKKQAALEREQQAKVEQAEAEETKTAQMQTPPPAPQVEEPETEQAPVVQPPQQQQTPPPQQQQPAVEKPKETAKPAAPVVKEGDLVEPTPDVTKPELTSRVNPAYPPAALAKKIEGTVILSLLITETGQVSDVKVLRGASGPGLNDAAVAAARKWKFRPAVKAGKRVKVWVTYPIVFKLQS